MASILASIMAASLVLYVLLAGADYGAGLWDLFSSGRDRQGQKDLIANAIQPIWEANHVWLILIVVLLFSGFPPAFGAIMIALAVPLLLMLAGVVLRGASFVFRAYSTLDSRVQRAYGYVFSISSCFTPFLGGVMLGAVSGDTVIVTHDMSVNGYLLSWLSPFTVSFGISTLCLCAFLAAAYLTVEASTPPLRRAFRLRAASALLASIVMLGLTMLLGRYYAHTFTQALLHRSLAHGLEVAAGLALLVVCAGLYRDHAQLIRGGAAGLISCVTASWAVSQYPYFVRPQNTIFNSVASEDVVRDIVVACGFGALILFPSLGLLLYIFKDKRDEEASASSIAAER